MTQDRRSGVVEVLIVDDSVAVQQLLTRILEADPGIRVAGAVSDGRRAVQFVRSRLPGVVVMDIHMPVMDGFEATRLIMESRPVPIVVCSAATNPTDVATAFRVLEAGAVACVEKPVGLHHPDHARVADHLRQTVRLMSEVKVVRRWPRTPPRQDAIPRPVEGPSERRVIAIGASTGGPQALQQVLGDLPRDCGAPILIVQHIARGFLAGLAEWLQETTGRQIHIAGYGLVPKPGHAYFAPDDFHMGLQENGTILLTRQPPVEHLRPSVSVLFRSVADVCGARAIGVLLTGMGRDGAADLKLMRDRGALTIAQDRETSVVNGMPGEAVRLGGASLVLPLTQIADAIVRGVQRVALRGVEP